MRSVRLLISGHVQGVGFRWAVDAGGRPGVGGWVRNLSDGRVEARLEGDDAAVDGAIAFCRRGPDIARVESVDLSEVKPEGVEAFRVR